MIKIKQLRNLLRRRKLVLKKTSAGKKSEKISASKKNTANNAIKSKVKTSGDSFKGACSAGKKNARKKKILEESYVSDPPDDPLERLANTFDNSARRWEMVVYPSLFAFVLLAGYGFFLIYRLTHDIFIFVTICYAYGGYRFGCHATYGKRFKCNDR